MRSKQQSNLKSAGRRDTRKRLATGFTWKIGGEAGFGIATSGQMFARLCACAGRYTIDYSEKPNLIRGGHNVHQVTIADRPVYAVAREVDLLLALNRETIFLHASELARGAAVIYDGEKEKFSLAEMKRRDIKFYSVPMARLAREVGGDEVMRNTVGLGATMAIMGCDMMPLEAVIEKTFGHKGDALAKNKQAARLGFEFVKLQWPETAHCPLATSVACDNIVIAGNEAMALGAVQGGCTFFAAYPMSPSSSILHFLAGHTAQTGMVVKHAEDEISVINMALGASYAGARSMVATSGGGFALMVETLGLAGLAELPVVIAEVMRPGPATGMPTWTEAADLRFVMHAAQGEFPRAVLAPGDVEEAFLLTAQAHNIAERWQMPVIVLSDKYLGEGAQSVAPFDKKGYRIDRGKLMTESALARAKRFHRYEITADGVSPRSLPGQKGGVYLSNSYEHEVHGYSDETSAMRIAQADKRMRKLKGALADMPKPLRLGPTQAPLTFVTWGSVKGPVREAMMRLKEEGIAVNMIHFAGILPFHTTLAGKMLSLAKRLVLVENNATAQFGGFIREQTGIEIKDKILKYDGRPFFPEEIVQHAKKRLK